MRGRERAPRYSWGSGDECPWDRGSNVLRKALLGLSLMFTGLFIVISLWSYTDRVFWMSRPMSRAQAMFDIRDGVGVVYLYSWTAEGNDLRAATEMFVHVRDEFWYNKHWPHVDALHEILDPGGPFGACILDFCCMSIPMPMEPRMHIRALALPTWLVAVMFSIFPAVAFIRGPLRRRRRRKRGLCISCGYNLTGNESGVCSECGEDVR